MRNGKPKSKLAVVGFGRELGNVLLKDRHPSRLQFEAFNQQPLAVHHCAFDLVMELCCFLCLALYVAKPLSTSLFVAVYL